MKVILRPAVQEFAEAMERKLRKHDHDRGSDGWLNVDSNWLLDRAHDEWRELANAVEKGTSPRKIRREAVDLGNFAMTIFDREKD